MKRTSMAWMAVFLTSLAFLGSRSYTRSLPAAQDIPADGQQVANALSSAFNAVAEYASPSVVQINVEKKARGPRMNREGRRAPNTPQQEIPQELQDMLKKFFGDQVPFDRPSFHFEKQQFVEEGTGSGFVYDDKGHILTNAHVVDGADKIVVTFNDGVELDAKLIGSNLETDVAVIKVDSSEYKPLKMGDSSNLKVGQWVLALGSPFGLDHTVTAGIISATERQEVGINRFEAFIQTDAAINPGNSGGPLLDLNGRVVGINSAIATASRSNSGVGFAIPIDMASRIAEKLIKDGKVSQALVGINIDPLDPKLARQLGLSPKTKGLLVTDVGKDTPAQKAGLEVGDIILSFDGTKVATRQTLQYLVSTSEIGQSYPVVILRNKQETTVQVAPAEAEKVFAMLNGPTSERPMDGEPAVVADQSLNSFGFSVAPLSPELAEKYEWDAEAEGVVVTNVDPDGPAGQNGMEVGDRITRIIRDEKITPVKNVKDIEVASKGADVIAVYVEDVRKELPGQFMTLNAATAEAKPSAPRNNR